MPRRKGRIQAALGYVVRDRFTRSVLRISGGAAAGQAILFLASPVLTRLYAPEDFGILAGISAFLGFSAALVCLRYESAIPLPQDDRDGAALLVLCAGTAFLFSILTAFAAGFGDGVLLDALGLSDLAPYARYLPLLILMLGLLQAFTAWSVRLQQNRLLGAAYFTRGAGQAGAQILGGLMSLGAHGLICGQLVASMIATVVLGRSFRVPGLRRSLAARLRAVAAEYRSFPLVSSWSSLINTAGLHITPLLLTGMFDINIVGQFALAQRIVATPMDLIGNAATQVFTGEAARHLREDPSGLPVLYRNTLRKLTLVVIIPAVVLIFFAPPVFELVFGSQWRTAGVLASVLVPMHAVRFVVNPLSQTLVVTERLGTLLRWNILRLALVLGSFGLAAHFQLPVVDTIAIYAFSMIAAFLLLSRLCFRCAMLEYGTVERSPGS